MNFKMKEAIALHFVNARENETYLMHVQAGGKSLAIAAMMNNKEIFALILKKCV